MSDYVMPKWMDNYITKICSKLDINRDSVLFKMTPTPFGRSDWWGAYIRLKNKPRIDLSTDLKRNELGKKIVIHELLHHKMFFLDRFVETEVFAAVHKRKREDVDSGYKDEIESYVWGMTEILYRLIENKDGS